MKQQLLWTKQMVLGRSDYHWAHEPLLYGCKRSARTASGFGDRKSKTLYEFTEPDLDRPPDKAQSDQDAQGTPTRRLRDVLGGTPGPAEPLHPHPTQKPVSLAGRAIKNSTLRDQPVLDLFAGSGSTLIAAELHGRRSFSMELSPGHCDAIVRRYLETFEDIGVLKNAQPLDPIAVGAEVA